MKTYTNKSNAARAAKAANGGTLDNLQLRGEEGAWYYGPTDMLDKVAAAADAAKAAMVRSAIDASNQIAFAGLQAEEKLRAKKATATRKKVDKALGIGAGLPKNNSAPAKKAVAKPQAAAKPSPAKPAGKPAAKKAPAKAKKAVPAKAAQAYDVKTGPTQGRISGYHIDTDRDEKHGVKRRSAGTIGGRLWSIFDKLASKAGGAAKLEIADVKAHKEVADIFNPNKVVIEFYYWRRYHGVRGRGKKQKVSE